MLRAVGRACSQAFAITGITPDFVDWALRYAQREPTKFDRHFPFGYPEPSPSAEALAEAKAFWRPYGITDDSSDFVVCFFGNLGRLRELPTVIEAARRLKRQKRRLRFVLCGGGDNLARYRDMAADCGNVIFTGRIGVTAIWGLMHMSSVGLLPYENRRDFVKSLPNKSIEYLAGGLPVVSSLKGVLQELLATHDCGVHYDGGDAEQLAAMLVNLCRDPRRVKTMSENARALYKERFVAERVYGEMSRYLEEVARQGRRRRKQ
jgi:glycosyltransferase involved in cell wall biosynthesis